MENIEKYKIPQLRDLESVGSINRRQYVNKVQMSNECNKNGSRLVEEESWLSVGSLWLEGWGGMSFQVGRGR